MTIETEELTSGTFQYLDWALETGIWDGRQISWLEASEFHNQTFIRVLNLLLKNDSCSDLLAAQLAWIGTPAIHQSFLARDIQKLDFSKSNLILQAGFKKSCSKFWKKHKTEILIGAAIVTLATVVIVIAVSSAGTGASAAVAAAGSALEALNEIDKEKLSKPAPENLIHEPPNLPANQLVFGETGVVFDGEYSSYEDILQQTPSIRDLSNYNLGDFENRPNFIIEPPMNKKPWLNHFLEVVGNGIIDNPELLDPNIPLPSHELSSPFSTLGDRKPWLGLSGINGMNTTKEEAIAHANHLAQYSQGYCVDWVYNQSHGPVVDMLEIIVLNLSGASPNTSDLLLERWTAFDRANQDNPRLKFLQFCHSQGAIHVRNALAKAPKEIRNRVIVQAFGPATLIPDRFCYQAWHYACKGDPIPNGEIALAAVIGGVPKMQCILEDHEKIIWVDPHPDTKSPHDFQNPAFSEIKDKIINSHLNRNGEY